MVSQKCQYALRALMELSKRMGQGPISVSQIAREQDIPPRFLELIFGELRKGGFVTSRRGARGGFILAHSPADITAADIIRYVDGPLVPIKCLVDADSRHCNLREHCSLMPMWQQAADALSDVYGGFSLETLAEQDKNSDRTLNYVI